MKKTLCRTMMAMALLLLAVSCEKDRGGLYQGEQGGSGGASGKQVVATYSIGYSKYYNDYSLKYTEGYADGTKITWSGNRLKGFSWMDYENGAWVNDGMASFEYEGDSPTEIIFTGEEYVATYYITYTDGYPTEIYMVLNDGYWNKTNYSYDSDGKLRTSTRTSSGGSSFSSSFTWTGDNLTAVEEHESTGSEYHYSYTYDSKKSPNNNISLPLKLIMCGDDYSTLSANNVILMQRTHSYTYGDITSTNTDTYTYAYTYDGDYPVKCIRAEREEYDEYGNKREYTITTYYEYADGTGASQLPKLYEIVDGGSQDEGYVYGDGVYTAGTEAVLYVYAQYQHQFLRWSDGVTDNPRHITVNSNATYTPIYSSNILLSENFDNGIPTANGWDIVDVDNDGYTWYGYLQNYGHNGSVGCARSDSYNNSTALTPTNQLYTPYLDIPATGAYLTWYVAAQDADWPSEFYRVYVGVNGNYTQVYSETVTAKDKAQGTWRYRYVNLNSYANKQIDIMFEHTDCTDQFALCIDDIEVMANSAKGTAKMKSKKMRQKYGFRLPWSTNHDEKIIKQ